MGSLHAPLLISFGQLDAVRGVVGCHSVHWNRSCIRNPCTCRLRDLNPSEARCWIQLPRITSVAKLNALAIAWSHDPRIPFRRQESLSGDCEEASFVPVLGRSPLRALVSDLAVASRSNLIDPFVFCPFVHNQKHRRKLHNCGLCSWLVLAAWMDAERIDVAPSGHLALLFDVI